MGLNGFKPCHQTRTNQNTNRNADKNKQRNHKDGFITHSRIPHWIIGSQKTEYHRGEGVDHDRLTVYLKSKGINPAYVTKEQKIAHAKSGAFLKWKQQHMHEQVVKTTPTQAKQNILKKKEDALQESVMQWLAHEAQMIEHGVVVHDIGNLGAAPKVIYDTLEQALEHRNTLDKLVQQLDTKREEQDPYIEQIADMETHALEEVTWDKINMLTQVKEHQEFLLKLLTNKDSFVRKRIIDQNLAYLNTRLSAYLQAIGLPHEVKFLNDLSVEITELGRELDFDNLSRGERNRLILSLSFSFRDVWESLYMPINLLFIDEMIDSGMDTSGVENSLAILKKMARERSKSIFLVSHKDELAGRVNNVMKVVKENGFTSYDNFAEQD